MKCKYHRTCLSLSYSFLRYVNYGFFHSCFYSKLVQYAFDFQDFLSKDCHPYLFVSTIINLFLFLYYFYHSVIWVGWGEDRCLLDVIL